MFNKKIREILVLSLFLASFIITNTQAAMITLSTPTNVTAQALSSNSIKISWNEVTGASGYIVYYLSSGEYKALKNTNSLSYLDTDSIDAETQYSYKVRAYTNTGETKTYSNYSKVASVITPVEAPQGVTVYPISKTSIKITWIEVAGSSSYSIYRSEERNGHYTALKNTTNTTFIDTSINEKSTYYYKVKSIKIKDGKKEYSFFSDIASLSNAPATTNYITTETLSSSRVKVRWDKVEVANGYTVFRSESRDGNYKAIKNTKETSYTDSSLNANKKYYYKVKTYTISGNKYVYSEFSKYVRSRTIPAGAKYTNVLFIGNSLTFIPDVQNTFAWLAETQIKNTKVSEKMVGGGILAIHYSHLTQPEWTQRIKDADIVILQEGLNIDYHTKDIIIKIQKLFDKNVKFYVFLPYSYAINNRDAIRNLKNVPNLKCINASYAQDYLMKNRILTYDDLFYSDQIHPNKVFGYLAACLVYSTLYDTSCIGLPFKDEDMCKLPEGYDNKKIQDILQKAAMLAKGKGFDDFISGPFD